MHGAHSPVRVLHILTDENVGGAGMYLYYLLSAADRGYFDYSVILPEGAAMTGKLESIGVRVIHVGGIGSRSFAPKAAGALKKAIKDLEPDIVHTHSSLSGRLAAKSCGVPVTVMTKHTSDPPPRFIRRFPVKQLCAAHYKRTVGAAVATDRGSAEALRMSGMPSGKIHVITNGALPVRNVPEAEKAELRRKLDIPQDAVIVGIFARLEPEKAHETFLRAAAVCMRMTPDIFFLVVGGGSRRAGLEELAAKYGIASNVRFCGHVDDPAPYMAICSINVNTSERVETSNLALTEGLSLGLVPVVSDIVGSMDIAGKDGTGCGIVCRRGEPPEFADAILSLIRDPKNLRFLSAAAKREFENRTASSMARSTEQLYKDLIGGPDGAPEK